MKRVAVPRAARVSSSNIAARRVVAVNAACDCLRQVLVVNREQTRTDKETTMTGGGGDLLRDVVSM